MDGSSCACFPFVSFVEVFCLDEDRLWNTGRMSLRPESPLLAPSLLSADFTRLGEELGMIAAAGAQVVHVDVMDGRFVPNITIGLPVVEGLRKATALPLDCHLMIVEPLRYAADFVKAGADWVSIHQEADPHLHRTLAAVVDKGNHRYLRVGVGCVGHKPGVRRPVARLA